MGSALLRPLIQLAALLLFFFVPLLNLFRMDLENQYFYILRQKFSFSEGYILLLAILTLVFSFVSISQWFGRQFCGWLCPHNTFVGYLTRITKWQWLTSKVFRHTLDIVISVVFAPIIAYCTLAYFINPYEIWHILTTTNLFNMTGISFIVLTGFFFVMINRLRYKFCQNACPYGMLQMILSNGNQKRTLSQSIFSGVGIVLLTIMTLLVASTFYFALSSPGYMISVAKKVNGVPSENQLIYSFELKVENLKDTTQNYKIAFQGLPEQWKSDIPAEVVLNANESKTLPIIFRISEPDFGKNFIIEVIVTNDENKVVKRKLSVFPIRK